MINITELDNLAHKARATLLNIHNTGIDCGDVRPLRAFLRTYNVGDFDHGLIAQAQECVSDAAVKARADAVAACALVEMEGMGWTIGDVKPHIVGAYLGGSVYCIIEVVGKQGRIFARVTGGKSQGFTDATPRAIAEWVASHAC